VELYFLPNTLSQDEVVTINVLTSIEEEPPVRQITSIYDFAPVTLRLNAIKRATLTISYDSWQGTRNLSSHRWALESRRGAANPERRTISAAVLSLGSTPWVKWIRLKH
jgi:hypothetical protein